MNQLREDFWHRTDYYKFTRGIEPEVVNDLFWLVDYEETDKERALPDWRRLENFIHWVILKQGELVTVSNVNHCLQTIADTCFSTTARSSGRTPFCNFYCHFKALST